MIPSKHCHRIITIMKFHYRSKLSRIEATQLLQIAFQDVNFYVTEKLLINAAVNDLLNNKSSEL